MTIPKVCSLYWDGRPLSYLQYLTVVSFKKHNPSWRVNLFMPRVPSTAVPSWSTAEQQDKYTGENYLEELKKLCTVRLIDFEDALHEVHRSDLIRWKILYDYGGVWSDMDILYIRPIPKVETTAVVFDGIHHIIGFYITPPNQPLFYTIYIEAVGLASQKPKKYQVLGSTLLNRLFPEPPSEMINLPMDVVYPYTHHQIEEMFFGNEDRTTPETVGIHWYNGSSVAKKYQNNFDLYRGNDSVISKYVREYV